MDFRRFSAIWEASKARKFADLAQLVPSNLHGSPAPIISIARTWRLLKPLKTMNRRIGPGGSDWMKGLGGIGIESLDGDSRNEDWREV